MEGNSTDIISFSSNAKKVGFETVISLQTNAAFVAANALAADGTVLGTTDVWDMELGATVSNHNKMAIIWFHKSLLEVLFGMHKLTTFFR